MDNQNMTIDDLLDEACRLPEGDYKIQVIEQAIQLADLQNDIERGFEARLELMQASYYVAYPDKIMVAIAWCLAQCDAHPEDFEEMDVLWQYKWVVSYAIEHFPQIGIDKINAMIDDFDLRGKRNGQGARSVLSFRYHLAKAQEQDPELWFKRWEACPRDDLSDCRACELNDAVDAAYHFGNIAQGLKKAEKLIKGSYSCHGVPHITLANALIHLVKTGDLAKAKQYHKDGYRMCGNDVDYLHMMGQHALFLALTGNFERAQKLFSENVANAFKTHKLGSEFTFWVGILGMLDIFERHQWLQLSFAAPKEAPFWQSSGAYSTSELRSWVQSHVQSIAQRFDARNGHLGYQKRIKNTLEVHQYFVLSPLDQV